MREVRLVDAAKRVPDIFRLLRQLDFQFGHSKKYQDDFRNPSIEMKKLYLHAVVIKKTMELKAAHKKVKEITKRSRVPYMRLTEDSYRFRNIPKTRFDPSSFRTKRINDEISLIFGHLRD